MPACRPPVPPGFYVIVCEPAPLAGGPDAMFLKDVLRPVVRTSRGGVLISATSIGPVGMVGVVGRLPDGRTHGRVHWFGPVRDVTEAELLADWLAIGGPLAPTPPGLVPSGPERLERMG